MRPLLRVVTIALLAACGEDALRPGPGELEGVLVTPNNTFVGAAVVELSGGVRAVSAVGGNVFTSRSGDAVRAVIVLDQPRLLILRVSVDDVTQPPTATVIEVSDAFDKIPGSLAGYQVHFGPVSVR